MKAPQLAAPPMARPESPVRLAAEISALPAASTIAVERNQRVVAVRAHQAPTLMAEVGRCRELTFRAAGEGTGRVRDLDAHDAHYLQLVLWDDAAQQVIGGYRLGFPGALVSEFGLDGLYTHQSFEYPNAVEGLLGPAIELGRSFVVPEHQRSFGPLLLLWRGIGEMLIQHRQAYLLLGALSVSTLYSEPARAAIAGHLLSGPQRSPWADNIRARIPFDWEAAGPAPTEYRALEERVLTLDGRKPPILVKQYLQLGMRGLACGIDPNFGDCLDILCVADLRHAPLSLLRRYMGEAAAREFVQRPTYGAYEHTHRPAQSGG